MATRLKVNPIQCTAHGLCAELLPEHITLDEWGYPIVDGEPVNDRLVGLARKAADACPTLALLLERDGDRRAGDGAGREPARSRR